MCITWSRKRSVLPPAVKAIISMNNMLNETLSCFTTGLAFNVFEFEATRVSMCEFIFGYVVKWRFGKKWGSCLMRNRSLIRGHRMCDVEGGLGQAGRQQ